MSPGREVSRGHMVSVSPSDQEAVMTPPGPGGRAWSVSGQWGHLWTLARRRAGQVGRAVS